ncbi:MAG: hypothetical protein WA579_11210 [Rhodomicrobium sp.]
MRSVQLAVASLLALLLSEEANAGPCSDPKKMPASQPEATVKCETVVRKRAAKSASAPGYSLPPAAQNTTLAPPQLPSSLKPDWVYVGSGIVDSHIGEKRIFVDGRPTDRYSGVTLITPFEQSQYNPYPVGPEIGIGWKTPALAAFGITDIGAGFSVFRNSLYRTATILGFRVGHDLAAGINAGLIVGPIFSGYSQPVAVAAELEFDLKQIAISQRWNIADVIPNGLVIKNRVMPCKAEFWAPGEGVNAAFELWAGFKFSLQ